VLKSFRTYKYHNPMMVWNYVAFAAALAAPCFLLVNQGFRFWFKPSFSVHRIMGLTFILQYILAWFLFITRYELFVASPLPYTMSANLLIQVTSAIYYFRFLPKVEAGQADPGLYSDKGILPYPWVKENLFFALLITWGNFYYHPAGLRLLKSAGKVGLALEILWVFFPFEVIRPFFPKTSLRNAFTFRSKTTSEENRVFYDVMTWAGKLFYMLSKHCSGMYLQYVHFTGNMAENDLYWVRWFMLMNIGVHNFGTFTHTLRFKKLISPRLATTIYLGYWLVSNYAIFMLTPLYGRNWQILLVSLAGMFVNFVRIKAIRLSFQVMVCAFLVSKRVSV